MTNRKWIYHNFILKSNRLLYHQKNDSAARLYIPATMDRTILELVYDGNVHASIRRTYDRIYELVFISHLQKKLKIYINTCPVCQKSKSSGKKPYDKLQPIQTSVHSFEMMNMDFIITLSAAQEYNIIMTVICKYMKFIGILSEREDWIVRNWTEAFFDEVIRYHLLFKMIVSDQNAKFTGSFWKHLLQKYCISSHMTMIYHSAADGQAERSNQSVEITLRYILSDDYEEHGSEKIPEMKQTFNILVNVSTDIILFEVLYEYPVNYRLNDTSNLKDIKEFMENRKLVQKDLEDALALAKAKMATYFNVSYRSSLFIDKIYIKLVRNGQKDYQLSRNSKLSAIKIESYLIKCKIDELAYELELPLHIRIHPVISCIHLKQYRKDPYNRYIQESTSIIVGKEQEWIVEQLIKERQTTTGQEILMKGKGFGETDNTWKSRKKLLKNVPEMIIRFEKGPSQGRSRQNGPRGDK